MKMKEFILNPPALIILLLVITIIVGVQFIIAGSVQAFTKVAEEGPCTFKSWSGESQVRLNLDCNGTEAWTKNTKVILGYLAKPGPLTCFLRASGKAYCDVPK
jgi:hypothetical protein